jgi:FKBP-type peptidyl-prolyl cis-trans isomerase SlyD
MPLAGLQRVIEGLDEGDPFDAVVPAAEAFGPDAPGKVMEVPRKSLGRDVLARSFVTVEVEGRHVPLFVERVEGRRAWVRLDHPFTGRDVRAEGTVIHVRHATFEEVEHGHVHGPGTHH